MSIMAMELPGSRSIPPGRIFALYMSEITARLLTPRSGSYGSRGVVPVPARVAKQRAGCARTLQCSEVAHRGRYAVTDRRG